MPKRENYDKNNQSSEAQRQKSQAITQSPERKIAQLKYRIASIDEAIAAGRVTAEEVLQERERLNVQMLDLQAVHFGHANYV
jgi:hypothetical protein